MDDALAQAQTQQPGIRHELLISCPRSLAEAVVETFEVRGMEWQGAPLELSPTAAEAAPLDPLGTLYLCRDPSEAHEVPAGIVSASLSRFGLAEYLRSSGSTTFPLGPTRMKEADGSFKRRGEPRSDRNAHRVLSGAPAHAHA